MNEKIKFFIITTTMNTTFFYTQKCDPIKNESRGRSPLVGVWGRSPQKRVDFGGGKGVHMGF